MKKLSLPAIHRIGVACGVAVSASIGGFAGAQDLPIVPGVVLLHSNNPKACVSGEAPPIQQVLSTLQSQQFDLRTVSMTWSDIAAVIATDPMANILQPDEGLGPPDRDPNSQQPTVHRFPDNRIFEEIAACGEPATNEEPSVEEAPGRIWALDVATPSSAPSVALPEAWVSYAAEAASSGQTLATCLLLGGALPRQPAMAARISTKFESVLSESLTGSGDVAHIHSSKLASELFNPGSFRMRGWDLALVASLVSNPVEEKSVCELLTSVYLGDDVAAPALGTDPLEAFSECPEAGLGDGEALRKRLTFKEDKVEFEEDPVETLSAIQACAVRSSDSEQQISLTIEAYGSVDGGNLKNWNLSRGRAAAVFDELESLGIPTVSGGFGESRMFGEGQVDNRVAFVTLTGGPILELTSGGIDSALLRRYLESDTCGEMARSMTGDLLPFLASPFGSRLIDAVDPDDFVIMFHNATDTQKFARDLQSAAAGNRECRGGRDTTHAGFLYKRTGEPFWQDPSSQERPSGDPQTDYFILPPKITWIYPVDGTTDFTQLANVAREYGITSQNIGDLSQITSLGTQARQDLIGQVDVLTVTNPAPISTVLQRLAQAKAGTGWVNLTAGWD